MPRRQLTEDEKAKMQAARQIAKQNKDAAIEAIQNNPQFTNPKFWLSIDDDIASAVAKAISQARKKEKMAKIRLLEKKLAELKGE